MKNHRPGFTLVELIVTITIIITLAGLSFVGVRSAREKAKTITEISGARNLITAYLGYSSEHGGQLLPGFLKDPTVTNLKGELVGETISARYPFRLAPYAPAAKGVFFFNGNEAMLEKNIPDYMLSLKPNMGINATFVGGWFQGSTPIDASSPRIVTAYGNFFVKTLSQADDPAKLIVFASARDDHSPGYHAVTPPNGTSKLWGGAKYTPEGPAKNHGNVDFRWGGKAVTAMLGGNVELHTEKELRDMRRWSHQAARADDKDFIVTRQ